MGSSWPLLLPELIIAISKQLSSVADYIRFRSVCRSWRSATSPRPCYLPVQIPWLMLPPELHNVDDSTHLFIDLSAKQIHRLDLPETRGAEICGSSHGWLILHKGQVTSLFNPITHATITLPPLNFPLDIATFDMENAMRPTAVSGVSKAILTSSPGDPSCMVLLSTNKIWEFLFCKIGDERWGVIQSDDVRPAVGYDLYDFAYSNGTLYAIKLSKLNTLGIRNINLVKGVEGDVMVVYYHGDQSIYVDGILEKEIEHTVYRISIDEMPKWTEVHDVGKNVLFLNGRRQAFSLLRANLQLPEWIANCLCYVSERIQWKRLLSLGAPLFSHKIKVARLYNGMVVDMTRDLGLLTGEPLWLTPSFF